MPYTYLTFAQAKTELARRLGDASKVFWSDTELGLYIKEALRYWAATAEYWRARGQFATTSGTAFYSLNSASFTDGSTALLQQTLKDQDILQDIQVALLEPLSATSWTGTDQFTLANVQAAMERRRNQFLQETGMVLTRVLQTGIIAASPRVTLSNQNSIDVRRVAWYESSTFTQLWRADNWQSHTLSPTWTTMQGTPETWQLLTTPQLQLELQPAPINNGALELIYVLAGATLDVASGVVLGVPDNWAWVVKWGTLADLLEQDGQSRDYVRAKYCKDRWTEGIQLARAAPSVLEAEINGLPASTCSVHDLDALQPNWQNDTGAPEFVGMAGYDLVALANMPNGVYSVVLDVVRNAIVPSADGDNVQLGKDQLEYVLGYAQHLAAFKMGGLEFLATQSSWEHCIEGALIYNRRLQAQTEFYDAIFGRAREEAQDRPRLSDDEL